MQFKLEFPLESWREDNTLAPNYPTFDYPTDAKESGYQSKTFWKSKNRVVLNEHIPSAVVPTGNIGKSNGLPFKHHPYLSANGNSYHIATGYLYYYSEDRTVSKSEAKRLEKTETTVSSISSISSYSPPPSSSPLHYVVHKSEQIDVSPIKSLVVTSNENEKKRETKRAYIPSTFDIKDLPEWLWQYENNIQELFHILHHRRLQEQLTKHDYVNLKAEYLRICLGRTEAGEWVWDNVKPHLLDRVIETDHRYEREHKSYGYRLVERYRNDKMVYKTIVAPTKHKELETPKLPVHKFLINNLQRLGLDANWETVDNERLVSSCQRISDGAFTWTLKDKFGHRMHHNLTNAPRTIKHHLVVDNQHLVEIDLANSQLLWAALEIKQRNIEGCERYIELCETGKFYDYFTQFGFTRQEIKDEFRESILFKRNGYNSKIKTLFKQHFPQVNRFFEKCKQNDPKNFAKLLQRREAKFVIYTVVNRLRKMLPDMFILTIHDAILCCPQDVGTIKQVIAEEARVLGLSITTKETHYGQ